VGKDVKLNELVTEKGFVREKKLFTHQVSELLRDLEKEKIIPPLDFDKPN